MYTDFLDAASENEQRERDYLATVRKPVEARTGRCKACDTPLKDAQAFVCDNECQKDWERIERARRIAGA